MVFVVSGTLTYTGFELYFFYDDMEGLKRSLEQKIHDKTENIVCNNFWLKPIIGGCVSVPDICDVHKPKLIANNERYEALVAEYEANYSSHQDLYLLVRDITYK